jgi:hypothetical protein
VGRIYDLTHQFEVLAVDDGVDRQITLNAKTARLLSYTMQVVNRERACRMGSHVQILYAEVHAVCPSPDGCCKAFGRTYWRHYLQVMIHKSHFIVLAAKLQLFHTLRKIMNYEL